MIEARTKFGPYTIVAPIGAGGMGEVYRAHDSRLGRDVAIKVLASHRASDQDAIARMVRESRIVAALGHPAIVTIHDVGDEAGQFYLVTELIEGETLREHLRRGALSIRETLEYAATIASALAAAHAKGVAHRDLKPENVMVGAGGLKILDFGVAKFVESPTAATETSHQALTQPGHAVGTPAYMAPEQLDGRTVDHRVDQFAFGVMVYEMLSGRRPFTGETTAEVSAAILRDDPAHLTAIRPAVPVPIARIVARCLAKNPDDRYASTTDLAHAIADARTDLPMLTPGAVAATSSGRNWMWVAVLAVIVVIVAAVAISWRGDRSAQASPLTTARATRAVAVLPFATIGDAEPYLADGLTEAVTRELGHIEGTRVIASSSAFAYRGRTEAFPQIGRELGADVLVRGSVQRAGDRLRVSATLVNLADDTTLWSNHYDRGVADVLAVQDDIAWQVAAKLAGTLGAPVPARPADSPKTTPAAYDAYLRGLSHMRGSDFSDGIAELERAVGLDPTFALAHALLASAYTQQFFYNASDPALEQKAFLEIQRALAINPDLAEAYLARAQLVWNLRNGFPHERAIADVQRALANNPSLAEAHIELGKLYLHIGLIDKAIAANQRALELDPRSLTAQSRLVFAKIDGAMKQDVAEELARNPQWPLRSRANALALLGRTDDAIAAIIPRGAAQAELEKIEMNEVSVLAQLFARKNRRSDAERALALAIPLAANPTGLSDTHHAQFAIGCTYALLGDENKAAEWVTKAANEGYPSYPKFSHEPDLASLKNNPRFQALLERLRKDHERWRTTL